MIKGQNEELLNFKTAFSNDQESHKRQADAKLIDMSTLLAQAQGNLTQHTNKLEYLTTTVNCLDREL